MKLTVTPEANSLQDQFEKAIIALGWNLGALAIAAGGDHYLNPHVQACFEVFVAKKGA